MSDLQNANDSADDLHDRFVDLGLRELIGGQQPPDLSERILAAAMAPACSEPGDTAQTSAATAAGAAAVAAPQLPAPQLTARRSANRWRRALAVAAGLLVAVGIGAALLLPTVGVSRSAARRGPSAEPPASDSSPVEGVQKRLHGIEADIRDFSVTLTKGDHNASGASVAAGGKKDKKEICYTVKKPTYETKPIPAASKDTGAAPVNRAGLPQRYDDAYARTMSEALRSDSEYRGRVEEVQRSQERLEKTLLVAQDVNGRAVQAARRDIDKAQARLEDRQLQIRDEINRGWHDGKFENSQLPEPAPTADGQGPGEAGDRYRRIVENAFLEARNNPLSTFSIDVDTASYANVRQFLLQQGVLPPADAVRIEELVNYFHYNYAGPEDARPFASHVEVADCPWAPTHRLVRVAIKGREVATEKRPRANLVFLIDVSGSMDEPQKLPLLVRALTMLTQQLRGDDRVAIVVYAGSEGLLLPSTPGESRETILTALTNLKAGGSTNGGAGINLAYKVAKDNFIAGGINRVILCTDGDFNVGVTSDSSLERLIEEKAKEGTFLTVLGFGRGNFNDSMLEALSGKGNGNYAYVDNVAEARKVLVEQLSGTLLTIAKDVKIQIEFNPARVAGYRLLGYEDRMLAAEDFNNDQKDAGEIGSGHTVTALYEIVPAGEPVPASKVDALKYQQPQKLDAAAAELLTLKIRYKEPAADTSQLIEVAVRDDAKKFAAATSDFQFAAAVAGFGMLLRNSEYKGTLTYDAVLEIASQHKGDDANGYRAELLQMVRRAKQIAGR